jgi:cytochrome c biogenesis protein CcdA
MTAEESTHMKTERSVCAWSPQAAEKRGRAWVFGSFVLCPCHLPLTLGFAAAALSGTALGALLTGHMYIAGAVISAAWLAGTWRGFHYLRSAKRARSGRPS